MIKEGIYATLFITNKHYTIINHQENIIARSFFTYKNRVLHKLKNKLTAKTFQLFSSLFLGNRSFKKEEESKILCKVWGISHMLARSGLHLVIFIISWNFFLRFLPLPFVIKQIFFILLVALYTFLSWTSISFIRALITFLLYTVCIVL